MVNLDLESKWFFNDFGGFVGESLGTQKKAFPKPGKADEMWESGLDGATGDVKKAVVRDGHVVLGLLDQFPWLRAAFFRFLNLLQTLLMPFPY